MIEYLTNLISAYRYTVTPYSRGIFLPKLERIRIDDFTNETFVQIFDLLKSELGEPIYTHSFYGHLWRKDGKVIAYCPIEEKYKYFSLNILILDKIPCGRKMPYEEYAQLENAIKAFADKYSFQCNDGIHYNYIDGSLVYCLYNNLMQLLLTIKGRVLTYDLWIFQRIDHDTNTRVRIIKDDGEYAIISKRNGKKLINKKKLKSINKNLTDIFGELDEFVSQ